MGGNLLLESLQDSSKYDSKNKSAGFGVSLCIPSYCLRSSSAWANAGAGKMNSDFKSVTEQMGLWADDGGFLVDVKNNTTLIGSVIAGIAAARCRWGGGFGFGGDAKAADPGLGTTKGGQVAGGATKDAGSSISTGSGGFGMGTPVVVAARRKIRELPKTGR